MNKNRAPAQEVVPLCGRCHFRDKQPMKGIAYDTKISVSDKSGLSGID